MHLKLGSLNTIVVSSPELAKQVLQKHDHVLSNRFLSVAVRSNDHHKLSMVYLPAKEQWRKLRKICREQIFSTFRLDASQGLRREKLQKMFNYVQECCADGGRVVDVRDVAFITSLNLVSATLFSIEFAQFDSVSGQEMKEVMRGLFEIIGAPSLVDFFPVLEMIYPLVTRKKSGFYSGILLSRFDEIIEQRLESRSAAAAVGSGYLRKDDLLEELLDSQAHGNGLSHEDIKHLFLDLIVAGSDTTANSLEWAMTELLRNPEKMAKAKDELHTVIGKSNHVEESDISRLPYLRAVIKETLRFHPTGPLLIPHKGEVDIEINGYLVPKDAQILVNVWAISRHPSLWPNPDSFTPERFLENEADYKGQDFEFIPFGSGRRMCPGLPIAHRMLHLILASLIHNFDWDLERGIKPQELDNKEKFGFTLQKAVPLKAVPNRL